MGKLVTSVGSFRELADAVRSGKACIPVTRLTGLQASVPDPCFGSLVVDGDNCELRLRSVQTESLWIFQHAYKVMEGQDTYEVDLDCVLDGHLHVRLGRVRRGSTGNDTDSGTTFTLHFNEITCAAECAIESAASSDVLLVSRIARSELRHRNLTLATKTECSLEGELGDSWKRDGLGGDIAPYRYKIRQENEDLILSVKLLNGATSPSAESDLRFMSALIVAFVWLNGGHPYAYYRMHKRDGELLEGTLQPLVLNPRSNAYLLRSHNDGKTASAILESGIRFFSTETDFAKDLRLFLWQYRDATEDGPVTLGKLLQACSLLEGIIGLTLRHTLKLSQTAIGKLTFPGEAKSPTGTAKARFHHAGVHLGFDWTTQLEPAFQVWKGIRDALAHGNLAEMEQHPGGVLIDNYCRIIQAFNATALRLIGYKGTVYMNDDWFAAGD